MTDENQLLIFEDTAQQNRWDALAANCPFLSSWGLSILRQGLEQFAPTLVLETKYVCKDHRNLHSHFYSKKFKERLSTVSVTPGAY